MEMNKTRVIPILLLQGEGLVKTIEFGSPRYVGDPINAVRIFNEKEVDEIVFCDISTRIDRNGPQFDLLASIAEEAFMPMAYGGGIKALDEVRRIFELGFEKVIINTAAYYDIDLIKKAVSIYGSQSIVGAIDVKKSAHGIYELYSSSGRKREHVSLADHIFRLVDAGVGEIVVNSIDRDGTMRGYDLPLLREVSQKVDLPVIACGGAGEMKHLVEAVQEGGVSAVAAGSFFVFIGPHRAVLINYPERTLLSENLP